MAVTFTLEQQRAIDLHGCNILVSAAAGSGKTAVLVERIVRMVCDETHPVDIDRLLIVTFTNAAAAEMRERISVGISKRLSENPESEHIQRQATLLHNAQITTIDSFCLYLLRNHFNEIGLDPAFRIADEGEVKLLQQEVLQMIITRLMPQARTMREALLLRMFRKFWGLVKPPPRKNTADRYRMKKTTMVMVSSRLVSLMATRSFSRPFWSTAIPFGMFTTPPSQLWRALF